MTTKRWKSTGGPVIGDGRVSFPFSKRACSEMASAFVAGKRLITTLIRRGDGTEILAVESQP